MYLLFASSSYTTARNKHPVLCYKRFHTPPSHKHRFLDFLASEVEVSVYIEKCLKWWVSISFVYAEHLRSLGPQIAGTLRAIHKAVARHNDEFAKMSCGNGYAIEYLKNIATLEAQKKAAEEMGVETDAVTKQVDA